MASVAAYRPRASTTEAKALVPHHFVGLFVLGPQVLKVRYPDESVLEGSVGVNLEPRWRRLNALHDGLTCGSVLQHSRGRCRVLKRGRQWRRLKRRLLTDWRRWGDLKRGRHWRRLKRRLLRDCRRWGGLPEAQAPC